VDIHVIQWVQWHQELDLVQWEVIRSKVSLNKLQAQVTATVAADHLLNRWVTETKSRTDSHLMECIQDMDIQLCLQAIITLQVMAMAMVLQVMSGTKDQTLTVQSMMMKAEQPLFRDDFNRNRLFFGLFQQEWKDIKSCSKIKRNIYKIGASHGSFILKGYDDNQTVTSMLTLSKMLHKFNFRHGMEFVKFPSGMYFHLKENLYWMLSVYIPHQRKFSFLFNEDRRNGLKVLNQFHESSKKFLPMFRSPIPRETYLNKWQERLSVFEKNSLSLSEWFNADVISEIVYYSHVFLEALERGMSETETVILHGDVASHNFIRSTDNQVYLIDYDLISIGSKEWDYAQYVSRMLPFIKWDQKKFKKLSFFQQYVSHPWFWMAASFPMDILREGNRFVNDLKDHSEPGSFANLSFFISTWNQRKHFLTNYNNLIQ
jgi:thiamine kinase-like enzyme